MLLTAPPPNSVSAAPPTEGQLSARRAHLLTINVEDYFQAGVFHRFVASRNWGRFDSRLERNVEETLAVLEQHGTTATFFVLGWIAEQHPELVRRISEAGHEVASRGFLHQPLLQLDRRARFDDLHRSRMVLEDCTGQPVTGFRLSDGWLKRPDLPFLEEVRDAGYLYDSSLLPRRREFRGDPASRTIVSHGLRNGRLLEIPPSTLPVAGSWLPISGGNYQRQLPHRLMRSAVARWMETESAPFVMYFQVWELDSEQPRMSVPGRLTQVRHYRNLGKYRWLLPEYLQAWRFVSVRDHAGLPDSPLAEIRARQASCRTASSDLRPDGREIGAAVTAGPQPVAGRPAAASARTTTGPATRSGVRRGESRPEVTLVIPCYNEEGSLPYLARTLEHLKYRLSETYDLHVIFVNDCSRDGTAEILQRLFGEEPRTRILEHETNRGVSAAILTGVAAASTDIVCSMDCDCSYDPLELAQMLPLLRPGVAMVTASPYHREGRVRNVPRQRLALSFGLSLLYRLLLRRPLATWTSCFRVYRRSQILDLPLHETGFLGTAELAAQLCLHHRTIVEHPAELDVRLFGASKMKTLRTILSHLRLLCRIMALRAIGAAPRQ